MEKGIILNGTSSIAIAKQDDLIYRLKPVETIVPITINNVIGGTPINIKLEEFLKSDYQVIGATVDFPDDDETTDQFGGEAGGNSSFYPTLKVVKNNIVTSTSIPHISESGTKIEMFFLDKTSTFIFYSSRNLNSIILYCQPIILEKQIVLA